MNGRPRDRSTEKRYQIRYHVAMNGSLLMREARLRAGLSQRVLAERLGTSHAAISRWERGIVKPTWETVNEAARACRLEVQVRLVERARAARAGATRTP